MFVLEIFAWDLLVHSFKKQWKNDANDYGAYLLQSLIMLSMTWNNKISAKIVWPKRKQPDESLCFNKTMSDGRRRRRRLEPLRFGSMGAAFSGIQLKIHCAHTIVACNYLTPNHLMLGKISNRSCLFRFYCKAVVCKCHYLSHCKVFSVSGFCTHFLFLNLFLLLNCRCPCPFRSVQWQMRSAPLSAYINKSHTFDIQT